MSNSNTNLQTQTSSVLQNVTVSSCSNSNIQEKTQLSRSRCMHSLKEIKSLFKFLSETLQDYGTMPIFKRTFSQDLDLLEQHLTKDILSRTDCTTTLTDLRTTFENAFNSELKARMQNYTRYDAQSFYDAMIFNMDSLGKYMLELILHQQRTPQLLKQKKLMQTQEDHSNPIPALNVDSLKVDLVVKQNTFLSKEDLKGTRIEHGFKRAFMSLFGQDVDTFTRTMLPNVDQLQKQLDKDEFKEDGSMTAFWVVNNQFQKFIDSKFTLDYDSQITDKYFVEYTGIEVQHFRDTLLQHLGNVKKSVAKRTRHQRQYERRVNKRQMQTQERKIDTGKALDVDLVDTERIRTDSTVQDDNSRLGNDTDADDADIRPIYDEEPMVEYPEKCQVKSPMLDSSPDNQTTEYSKQSLESENILLKKTVAQFQKDFFKMEDIALLSNLISKSIIKIRSNRFSPNKTSAVSEKTSPRSDLRWKPTGRNSKTDWSKVIPTDSYSTLHKQVDINPHMVSKVDIPNIHACKQTLDEKSQIMFRKEDISETIVKVDSQMMIQRNDV
ncbi:hypothetical protein Tco_0436379 [Tanacetum coccineum]